MPNCTQDSDCVVSWFLDYQLVPEKIVFTEVKKLLTLKHISNLDFSSRLFHSKVSGRRRYELDHSSPEQC